MRPGTRSLVVAAVVAFAAIGFLSWRGLSLQKTAVRQPRQDAVANAGGVASMPSREVTSSASTHAQPLPGQADHYVVTRLASQFDEFARLARGGDRSAARALYEALQDCQNSPVNARELDDFRRRVADPSSVFASMVPAERQRQVDERASLYEHCGDLSSFQRRSLSDWALQLAEAGDADVRLRYAFVGKPTDFTDPELGKKYQAFVARAKSYLEAAIDGGDPSALVAMAQAYMPSIIVGTELDQPFGVDLAQAYAYYYAYGLTGNVLATIVTDQATYNAVDGILARLEGQMTPQQLESAREAGRSIFERCCRQPSSK